MRPSTCTLRDRWYGVAVMMSPSADASFAHGGENDRRSISAASSSIDGRSRRSRTVPQCVRAADPAVVSDASACRSSRVSVSATRNPDVEERRGGVREQRPGAHDAGALVPAASCDPSCDVGCWSAPCDGRAAPGARHGRRTASDPGGPVRDVRPPDCSQPPNVLRHGHGLTVTSPSVTAATRDASP